MMMKRFALFLLLCLPVLVMAADVPAARPLKVVMFSGSSEYKSNDTLANLKKLLEDKYHCDCVLNIVEDKGTALTGVDALETADVGIFFTRRIAVAEPDLAKVKKFIARGGGVVGIRTASHGFQTWLKFDPEVLGGSYNNHYGKDVPAEVTIEAKNRDHPVLAGLKDFSTTSKLYKNPHLAEDVKVLLRAKTADYGEPVAWVRDAKAGARGRVFYTSLGAPTDFENPQFQQMLLNAVQWTAAKP
jgi:type 1 glutamine amidotransferase